MVETTIDQLVVKVKKLHPAAKVPTKAHPTDSGFDMYALEDYVIPARGYVKTRCGVAFEMPPGYEMQLRGRSGLSGKGILVHHGTIDNEYRGEVAAIMYNHTDAPYLVKAGDRTCQVVIKRIPDTVMIEVEELSPTVRGVKGFGSTGA